MAVFLGRMLAWFWGGNGIEAMSNEPSLDSASDAGLGSWELENVELSSVKEGKMATSTSSINVKQRGKSKTVSLIDREYDAVLVPEDGIRLSWSESDESDWSVGWSEPCGCSLGTDDEMDDRFAVLVPCYKPGCKELVDDQNSLFSLKEPLQLHDFYSVDTQKNMELWLSSLKKS